jgi:hypothetical protein
MQETYNGRNKDLRRMEQNKEANICRMGGRRRQRRRKRKNVDRREELKKRVV